jgi:hypothetical protein
MYDCYAKDTQPRACPERDEPNPDVWTDDIDDPVWREGGNAENNEEGYNVIFLGAKFFGPFIKTGFPPGDSEKGGSKGSTNEVAEGGSGCDAGTGKEEGTGDTPHRPGEDGEVHGPRKGESLEAREGKVIAARDRKNLTISK